MRKVAAVSRQRFSVIESFEALFDIRVSDAVCT